jgi:uncharacterized protein (TIGR00288 family)
MAQTPDHISMALFCDFENVALGVRDANYDKFDIKRVLEKLLLKGSIVVKKAYCDWERYKGFKATMHEANFELIEIPHVRQSGKNSADIRMVVDALDLCYTKSHVNTFVIISGDSDFSPLVSKLRENNKQVIGVGVKQSTSDLLIANCDEFIFYDELEEAQAKGLMAFGRDERSGAYVFRPSADQMATTPVMDAEMDRGLPPQDEDIDRHDAEQGDMSPLDDAEAEVKADATAHSDEAGGRSEGGSRRRGGARGGRGRSRAGTSAAVADSGAAHQAADSAPKGAPTVAAPPAAPTPPLAAQAPAPAARKPSRGGRSSRGAEAAAKPAPADVAPEAPAAKRPARKRAPAKRVKADTP